DILAIDYENKEIVTQQVYFENGLPDDRDIYCYDFDEIELMQSTGLKDKNGKEIFEGDIVRTTRFLGRADEIGGFYEYDKEFIGIVKQLEGSWVIDTGSDAVCLWTEIEENEIIGNIYENKEFGGRK
ncbi:TPA: YopX family protein, partial [Streptococcus pneumoniae]